MPRHSEEYVIPGFHAVCQALSSPGIAVIEVWIAVGKESGRVKAVQEQARSRGVPVRFQKAEDLEARLPGVAHQGFAAVTRAPVYVDLEKVLEQARRDAAPYGLILAADHITDEGNLGAVIRAAAFFGAAGLILPKDRSAGLSHRVTKRSAGASLLLPVARVVNLPRALDALTREGFWIVGAAGEAKTDVYAFDWNRHTVLVMGREDRGLSPNVRSRCQELVAVPGSGRVESLNVAVATGVILSEIHRQQKAAEREIAPVPPRQAGP